MSNNIFKSFDKENSENMTNDNPVQGLSKNTDFEKFKEKYKDKSDDELLKEAKDYSDKLKSQLGEAEYNKKLQELKKFEMFLNKEQKQKLNDFLSKIK